MNKFDNLSEDAKIAYLLSLTDLIINNLSKSEGYEIAIKAFDKCWKWLKFKNVEAHDLYFYLENIDEIDVMTYLDLETDEEKSMDMLSKCISVYNMGSISI